MHIIRITRHPDLTAIFAFLGIKNKVREVNKELFKGKYLGALFSIEDVKNKDSKVSPDCRKVLGYYEVGYYFTLGADKVNNTFLITFLVNFSSLSIKKINVSCF